jgi:hypothetical protein
MRIINEKGKLFGIINIIDFSVLFVLIFLIPAFYFSYMVVIKKKPKQAWDVISAEINCEFIKIIPEIVRSISVGDKEVGEDGNVIGEIISLGDVKPYTHEVEVGLQEKIVKTDLALKRLAVKLRLNAEMRRDGLYYNNDSLALDSVFEFKTKKYKVLAMRSKSDLQEKVLDLDVILKGLDAETVKQVCVGDSILDEDGKELAEILSLGKIDDNFLIIDLSSGNYIKARDMGGKQISARMRLKCYVSKDGNFYFQGSRVEYNTPFEFKTAKYKAGVVLTNTYIEEKLVTIQVRFSGVAQDVVNTLKNGDIEKESSGRIIGRIKVVTDIKNSFVFGFKENELIKAGAPFQKDVFINLEVLCVKHDNKYYYKDSLIKVGNFIIFSTDLYSISGNIISIESGL